MEKLKLNNKSLLALLIVVLIIILLANYFMSLDKDNEFNYENIEVIELFYTGKQVTDRNTYYILEDIIVNYLNSYTNAKDSNGNSVLLEVESKYTYEEYYDTLLESYKDYLEKEEYLKVADEFMDKFFVTNGDENVEIHYFMDTDRILKEITEIKDNYYICRLYSSYNNKEAYIGIKLDTVNNEYRIFIME